MGIGELLGPTVADTIGPLTVEVVRTPTEESVVVAGVEVATLAPGAGEPAAAIVRATVARIGLIALPVAGEVAS